MVKKIALVVVVLVLSFLGYVSTRESKFQYERSGVIAANKETIFPYLSNLKLGSQWSPYEKMDPSMKKNFTGEDGKVGSKMEFESKEAGTGFVEILDIVPPDRVKLRLFMSAPLKADNIIEYSLSPESAGTKFTWTMSGDGGFMGKLMTTLIDCEKMVGDQFSQGIDNLKILIEGMKK